ncbi:hypothetical protein [Halobacillus sp. BBL2006]|uniref:hypothetical protein n=1 Tax=Halobacillus sp. BBL2006 TaxID=1543706 RepID=UPI00054307DF|nr:hypothetical protein [Halobacillus sp. BBL2006]KHE70434.1 hypothetical protein LD39_11585 [Halobacillus sp. BBL2006]
MLRTYRDYFNQTVITLPDKFIDVKTGESHEITSKIIEEIEYHSKNNTLQHFILSALHNYLHHQPAKPVDNGNTSDLLFELLEIKRMLNLGNRNNPTGIPATQEKTMTAKKVNLKEIEGLLEAFGG